MSDSGDIFCRILDGKIPCHKLYEDENAFAFLDIAPLARGHSLVIPRRRSNRLDQMPPEDAAAIGRVLPRIATAVLRATGAEDFNLLQNNGKSAGQAVDWVHFHIIPRYGEAEPARGLAYHWTAGKLDDKEGAELAKRVRDALQR